MVYYDYTGFASLLKTEYDGGWRDNARDGSGEWIFEMKSINLEGGRCSLDVITRLE